MTEHLAWGNPPFSTIPNITRNLFHFVLSTAAVVTTQMLGLGHQTMICHLPPPPSKHLIKELSAAVNSEAKKESKHRLNGRQGSRVEKYNPRNQWIAIFLLG